MGVLALVSCGSDSDTAPEQVPAPAPGGAAASAPPNASRIAPSLIDASIWREPLLEVPEGPDRDAIENAERSVYMRCRAAGDHWGVGVRLTAERVGSGRFVVTAEFKPDIESLKYEVLVSNTTMPLRMRALNELSAQACGLPDVKFTRPD
jgi:hypothetical protein